MRATKALGFVALAVLLGGAWACGDDEETTTAAAAGPAGSGVGGGGAGNGAGGDGTGGTIFTTGSSTGAGGNISGCNPQSYTLKQSPPPEVYLVLDRSGSMLE